MFLHAAFTPPPLVREAISQAVQSAMPSAAATPPHHPRRGGLGRLTSRTVEVAERPVRPRSAFELVPAGRLSLPIAAFGNVAMRDAIKVTEALKEEAVHWATPTVHVTGPTVQELAGHRTVALGLDGDVAALRSIASSVTHCVHMRGFRFDRPELQPRFAVATIDDRATSVQVTDLLGALDAIRGMPWTVDHVSLVKRSFDTTPFAALEYQRIPLGRH